MNQNLLPPRWSGGPPICSAENLPAFESKAAIAAYHDSQCPSTSILEQWQCKACGMWHFDALPYGPSGASSGTTRLHKFPPRKRLKFFERADASAPLYLPGEAKDTAIKRKDADRAEDKRIQKSMRQETGV